jgi:hypothetical protein
MRVGAGTLRDRSAQIRQEINPSDAMFADRIVHRVKRRYRTPDAQQPMVEDRADGFRPAPHDVVHAQVIMISSGHTAGSSVIGRQDCTTATARFFAPGQTTISFRSGGIACEGNLVLDHDTVLRHHRPPEPVAAPQ